MTVTRALAVVTLVFSLAGNAFFAQALSRRRAPPEESAVRAEEEAPAAAPTPRPVVPAVRPLAPAAAAGPGAPVTLQQAQCAAQLSSLEETMAERSEALRGLLPPEPLFARGQPNLDAERLMAPIIARMLAHAGAGESPNLECKDIACKVVFTAPATVDDDGWDQVLATDAGFQAWSQQFALGPATPAKEGGKQGLVQRSFFFKLNGPRAVTAQAAVIPGNGRR
jgi:hypothetical protein